MAGLAVTFMLGRFYGASVTGQYALLMQTSVFLAALGLFGLDLSLVRHLSRSQSSMTTISRALATRVFAIVAASITTLALVLWVGGTSLWTALFGDDIGVGLAAPFCVLLILRAIVQVVSAFLRCQHRYMLGITISIVLIPGFVAIAIATGLAASVYSALIAALLGATLALIVGLALLAPNVSAKPDAIGVTMRTLIGSSLPLWGASFSLILADWYVLAVIGRTLGSQEVGIYRVAMQFASIPMVVSSTISSVYTPRISSAFHDHDLDGVARLARTSVLITLILTAPLVIVLVAAGQPILALVGPEFVSAFPVLLILVIGQFVFAFTGASGTVLAMSGNERMNLFISIGGTLSLLAAIPVMASHWGIVGAAAGFSAIVIMRNIVAYFLVIRIIGINIWTGKSQTGSVNISA
ncbi:MAG: oligosaccharide flippase family protein [Erythrobacter sp.]|uniref:lipopolysaccharide biosynthesis protein n=1 Tax=Erythrobacter sp. TaxID=1042 RepID=UPI0026266D8F|nr:oligosaccharide flippase family protein [Erythrobacter sp.]MDJ0979372.1 oligosaccharide flippase family protein [Erythrobacter sp.]